jgi:AcrR family transcriptional regulator
MARKYELKKRAEKQEETRKRIVDALVELHGEVGPANTTIKAVAERAGVQRLTVYRHFPDEQSMFQACSAQFEEQNPAPDPVPWLEIGDPVERLRQALTELYAYYERAEQMMTNTLRDESEVPALAEAMQEYYQGLDAYKGILLGGWEVADVRQHLLEAAIFHAIWFESWRSLIRHQRLETFEAVELMTLMVDAAAGSDMPNSDLT